MTMAHFAEIGLNNTVTRVIVVNDNECKDQFGNESETIGAKFCHDLFGGVWLQTSYNGNMRKNFASIGFTYDSTRNAFVPPKPFESWVLDEETCSWKSTIPMPTDGKMYSWDESTTSWVECTQ
jgi:hypothetical protein